MSETVDLIFFGAHPDDVELSAGGTVAKCVKDGLRVGIVDLTRGEMGTRGTPQTRKREAQAAAKALGATFRQQLDFQDGNLQTGREQELEIIEVLRVRRPKLVIAPWPDDRHPDHTRTGHIVTEASFYAGLKSLQTGAPAHRPQTVLYYMQNYMVPPSFVVDVTANWKAKMRAVAAFKSQFHDPKSKEPQTFISDPKFLGMIDARGRHFGALIGVTYGEAFVTKQPPRVDDLVSAYSGREV
ncbi:MAG TPA: bacillithiol biosynthesis deacetylase BshB1 [Thermoanaerobaculia bacterium]|jgi:bacillithiol biosynthesis deacetylase BshB1|nr:bacillithiol biosynthesis deacetylase BshB1 [Thermoanaerobaculia bacterium]